MMIIAVLLLIGVSCGALGYSIGVNHGWDRGWSDCKRILDIKKRQHPHE